MGARGPEDSPIVGIAEAPGAEELKSLVPLVGPSGELFAKCLPEGVTMDDMFILNAMQCRVRTGDPHRDKERKTKACIACHDRLMVEVFRHPRKVILAMGGWSNGSLLNNYGFKITQERGVVYGITDPQGHEIVVVPTVHPAYLLRGSGSIDVFKEDIKLALSFVMDDIHPVIRQSNWEDPNVRVVDNAVDLKRLYKELSKQPPIPLASDIETSGFNFLNDYMLCLGFYMPNKRDDAWIIPAESLQDPIFLRILKQLFQLRNIRFIWQFGKFDEKFLRRNGVIGQENVIHEDTGLLSYCRNEAGKGGHDLDEQAKNLLGAPDHKGMLAPWVKKKTDSYALVPRPVLYDYLAKDLKKTFLIWGVNRPIIRSDPHLEKLYTKTLLPASHFLSEVEANGIQVDWDYVRINREGATEDDVKRGLVESVESEIGLEAELVLRATELAAIAGWNCNPNSPGEVKTLLYQQLGLKIKGKTPKDTKKETLDKLPNHPAVKLVRSYRSTQKMLSTYVAAIEALAINNRIHTTYKLHVTPTGRLSSSDPNIQNIPRNPRLRRMYCAAPGNVLIEGDYNSAELRMLAVLSGDEFLTGVFLDGKRNLHDEVAIAMYGPNFDRDQRIRAKAINFGIPYGREAYSVAIEFDMPLAEAQRLIDAWFARAPQAAKFLKNSRRVARNGGTLITIFGRKRRAGVVSAERLHGLMNEFANFHMQSPISDFTMHSAIRMNPRVKKEGARIVNLVHDSILTECPRDSKMRIEQVSGIVKETMERVPTEWISTPIRFLVDLKVGTHWGLAKSYELGRIANVA